MTTVEDPHVVKINDDDMRFVTADDVRRFEDRLSATVQFAEIEAMRLDRLFMAHEDDRLGGWPKGFVFPDEHVAASALLADALLNQAEWMEKWASVLRERSAYLSWVRGPGVPDDAS